jgi:eukaryotic-like serine/threonine-protein kinase
MSSSAPPDDPQTVWDLLADRLDGFLRAWEAGPEPPGLADFVAGVPQRQRRLVLTELVKADQEQRADRGRTLLRVEAYLDDFPELAEGGVPCDLLYEEYHLRRRLGEEVQPEEYCDRFPDRAAELRRLLGAATDYQSTMVQTSAPTGGRSAPPGVGDVLDDFELLALLGKGAFASVFLARQRSMQRLVALKLSDERGAEAQTLAQLDHPNVVRVYDRRVLPDRGLCLLYMNYLPGGTLLDVLARVRQTPAPARSGRLLLAAVDDALARRGETPPESSARRRLAQMTWPEAVAWLGACLADALDYAHRHGVLHRDIKPANVLLGADAVPRLADFNVGCCSKLDGVGPRALFGGSLAYMSPEQLEAVDPASDRSPDSLDGRSDVYSLGVTLWELLTGSRPSGADAPGSWEAGQAPGAPLTRLPADCPPGLERALRKCLAQDPARRFATAGELSRALGLCLRPRTAALLEPAGGWRAWCRRHPYLAMLPTGLIANAVAGAFNYSFNEKSLQSLIDKQVADAGVMRDFWYIQLVINVVFFPLGIWLFCWAAGPVARALGHLERGKSLPADALPRLRARCLRLGELGAWVSLGLWLSAGVIYPVALNLAEPGLPASVYGQFVVSLGLCGLIAAAYPFFAGTFLALRTLYPPLVAAGALTPADDAELRRLEPRVWTFLAAAGSVPLLGVVVLVSSGLPDRLALFALCVAGCVGLGAAIWLMRRIQTDVADLEPAVGGDDAVGTITHDWSRH